jgi:hypothetical protein
MLPFTSSTAYTIVALLIWSEATFEESRTQKYDCSAKGKLPLVLAAAAAHTAFQTKVGDIEIKSSSKTTVHVRL